MAGNARFHNKLHRKNHHTIATVGYPDSATDPIASPQEPFQGDFVINGTLSCTGFQVNSADYSGNVKCENLTVRGTTLCNFISGTDTETIISDGALTGYGPYTLTMDYRYGVYTKSPLFVVTGLLSSLSSVSISRDLSVNNNLEIKGSSTIYGDLLINGNLSALGDYTIIETNISTTSALSIINAGSNTALTVRQLGNRPSASFFNDSTKVFEISSNGINVFGNGIFTGNINAININVLQATSSTWDNTYNNLTANSANWNNTYINISTVSSSWENTKTTLNTNSGNWENTRILVSNNNNNWSSVYNTTLSTSSNWVDTYNTVGTNSSNWSNTYNTVSSNSANWTSVYTTTNNTSSTWLNTYNTVSSTSSTWVNTYNTVSSTSSNWVNTYNTVSSNSANWSSTYNTINSTSSNWVDTYNTVNTTSSNWVNTYNTVNSTSSNWVDTYNTVTANSANWSNTYTTTNSNSSKWLSGASDLDFTCNNINVVNTLCANIIRVFQAIHVSVSAITVAPGTLQMTVNSPSYYFVNVNTTGTYNMNLPTTSVNNLGMMFYIKNVSTQANRIVVINNSAGTPIALGSSLAGAGNAYTQVVWDGVTWQTTMHA